MLNVALPKGRLGNQVYELFAQIGYDCAGFEEDHRKLVLENKEKNIRYFLVKPSDVAIYVERGAADVGVVGKDILLETQPNVYELLDLGIGRCRVAVAAPKDYVDDPHTTLRVATKYLTIAKQYYESKNRNIELIKLSGSIELAPIVGLSDVIVDIVETGATLRDNNMDVTEEIMPISAYYIGNKASCKFKKNMIDQMVEKLQGVLENDQRSAL